MKEEKQNSNNGRTILLAVIGVIALIVIVSGATFAFFATTRNIEANLPVNTQTASSMYSFTATANEAIEFSLSASEMSEKNVSETPIKNDTANIYMELASASDNETTTCTYDIQWVWDSEDMYTMADVELPYTAGGVTYPYELSLIVDDGNEIDLSDLTWDENKAIIASNLKIESTSKTPVKQTHKFEVKAYNIDSIQRNLFNKTFNAHLEVTNNTCTASSGGAATKTLASYITEEVYKEDGVDGLYYHDGVGTYTNANLEAGDNSYRYSGTDPNNYLCFKEGCTDDEKYRIIGVIDDKVKVIKMTNDGDRQWNSSGTNTWTGSTMETYLNNDYVTKLGESATLIDITTWHVGGFSVDQLKSESANGIYKAETTSTPIIDRKIGLMYASEYMYAAEPIYWSLVGYYDSSNATKDYRASKGHDWILTTQGNDWSISRRSDGYSSALIVDTSGREYSSDAASTLSGVRPTFNLSSSVKLTSGSGTSSDPYIVSA